MMLKIWLRKIKNIKKANEKKGVNNEYFKKTQERIDFLFKTNPEMIEKLYKLDEEEIREVGSLSQKRINPEDFIVAYESVDPSAMRKLYQ